MHNIIVTARSIRQEIRLFMEASLGIYASISRHVLILNISSQSLIFSRNVYAIIIRYCIFKTFYYKFENKK